MSKGDDDYGEPLYDETGRRMDQGFPPGRRFSLISEGLNNTDEVSFVKSYSEFVDRFQEDQEDLDDLLRDYGLGEGLTNDELELRYSDEDVARYNLRAGVLTVEPNESGWRITYEQDDRIEVTQSGLTDDVEEHSGNLPTWAKVLSGSETVTEQGIFVREENYPIGEEPRIARAIEDIAVADKILADNSKMKSEFLVEAEEE